MKSYSKWTYLAVGFVLLMGCLDTASGQTNAFVIGPTSLSLSTPTGFSPSPATLSVSTTGASVNFSITTTGGSNCTINYQASTSLTPSQVTVFAQTASLPAGTYNCSAVFSATGVNSVTVPITITVGGTSGSGALTVAPTSLTLTAQAGGPAVSQTLTLTNSNPSVAVSFTASATSSPAGWLLITPTSGTVSSPATIQVQASPAGLVAGTFNGNISITPAGGTAITVPVSLTVSGNPSLVVQQGGSVVSDAKFAYQIGTSLPGSQTLNFASSNASSNLPFTISVNGGAAFLIVSPTGSLTTPANVSLSLASTASGLPAGTYNASIVVSAPGASNPSFTIPVSFQVSATPLLIAGAPPSAFNYTTGGTLPSNQTVQISTSSTALPVTVSTTLPAGQNWLAAGLSTTTASAAAPAILTIGANPTGLPAGTYTGSVTVSSPTAGNLSITIPVTLNVSTSTLLNVSPSQLTFTYQTGGQLPFSQSISVSSSAASLNFTVAPTTAGCGAAWLVVGQTSGTTGVTGVPISVSVNPSGIPGPSVCQGTVTVTAAGASNSVSIPVTLEVSASPIIQITNPNPIAFTGQLNSGSTNAILLTLVSSDTFTPLAYTVSSPATWLFISPTSGSTPVNLQIAANTNAAGLQIGANTTTITLTSPSLPAPITIPVTLNITSSAIVAVTPVQLTFTQPASGPTPASQSLSITVSGGTGVASFQAAASVTFGSWLTVTPTSGNIPGTITVTANGANLSQGTYNGQIQITAPGASNPTQTIPVTLTVTQPQTINVSLSTLSFNSQAGQTTPPPTQAFQVTSTGGAVNFTVGTSVTTCPGFLSATPASGTTPAPVTVSVNVTGLAAGTCGGTVTVSATGIGTQTVNVTLTVAGLPAPQVNSIVNGASFVPGPVAPGEIVTLFGSNLGPASLTTYAINPDGSFATRLAETEVLFDGVAAPILFVRNDQVAVVVPFDVAGRFQTNIQVRRSSVLSNSLQQRVVDTAPGIFTVPSGGSGQGAIVNQNGVVNASSVPAARNSVVSMYITGAGQTNPRGITGTVSPGGPLNFIVADVTVTVGGVPATVQYKGGAPGNIQGLYQINVTVPAGAGSGSQAVMITVGGVQTQGGVVMYIQ